MRHCDTLLIIGSRMPYSEYYPEPGQARAVQIDIDGRMLGFRYPHEVNLEGDAATTLQALLPLLEPKADTAWRETVEGWVASAGVETFVGVCGLPAPSSTATSCRS